MSKRIPLTQGKSAIVDDEDFEAINQHKWCFDAGYAHRREHQKGKKIWMHRVIANTPVGMEADHMNGNGLDNRRTNLRNCSHHQNSLSLGLRKDSTSGFKGVAWHKRQNKWQAKIGVSYQRLHLGYFDTAKKAAIAYDVAAKAYFREFAKLNFQEGEMT